MINCLESTILTEYQGSVEKIPSDSMLVDAVMVELVKAALTVILEMPIYMIKKKTSTYPSWKKRLQDQDLLERS